MLHKFNKVYVAPHHSDTTATKMRRREKFKERELGQNWVCRCLRTLSLCDHSMAAMIPSMEAELIMEFTDAEIVDALTANIAPPDAPPRHAQPPPQPPLQTCFVTRPPPTAAIPEASCALRAVEVVSAWFDVPAVQAIAPNSSSVNRKRARPNRGNPYPILLFFCLPSVITQAYSNA